MRWPCLPILFLLAACSSPELPKINSPWDPVENQASEPTQPAEAGVPAWERIGSSIRGKPIQAVTMGSGSRRVYIIGGLHGDEPEGPTAAGRLPGALLNDLTGDAGQGLTVRILRDANPDGTMLGTRGNTRGTDLNRNFPARDFNPESLPGRRQGPRAASEIEVNAVLKDLHAFKPDVVLVFRTAALGRGPQVAFDGPALSMAYDFASGARAAEPHWRVATDKSFLSTGSVDSLAAGDMHKPVLSVEFKRSTAAVENAKAMRAAILALAVRPPSQTAPQPAAPAVPEPVLGGR